MYIYSVFACGDCPIGQNITIRAIKTYFMKVYGRCFYTQVIYNYKAAQIDHFPKFKKVYLNYTFLKSFVLHIFWHTGKYGEIKGLKVWSV